MKECPKCRKAYTDDLFFCLDDGTPLTSQAESVDPTTLTEPAFNLGSSLETQAFSHRGSAAATEVLSAADQTVPTFDTGFPAPPQKASSKLAYVAIAVLVLVCVSLATALVVLNRKRIFSSQDANAKSANDIKSVTSPSPESPQIVTASTPVKSPVPEKVVVGELVTVGGRWKGEWSTTSGTLATIELTIKETDTEILDGQIHWVLQESARPDKADKIGLSATEFVRGTFEQSTGLLKLSGYRKDDPDGVLVMLDDYKLTLSKDGKSITGVARNGGKWDGHIKLSR